MPPRRGRASVVRPSSSQKSRASQPTDSGVGLSHTGRDWCACQMPFPPYGDRPHRPGEPELPQTPCTRESPFLTLRIPSSLIRRISALQPVLDVHASSSHSSNHSNHDTTVKGCANDPAKKAEFAARKTQRAISQKQVEQQRAEAEIQRASFVTLRYRRNTIQRQDLSQNWPTHPRVHQGANATRLEPLLGGKRKRPTGRLHTENGAVVTHTHTRGTVLPFIPKVGESTHNLLTADDMDDRRGIKIDDGGIGDDIRNTIFDLATFQSRVHAYRPEDKEGLVKQLDVVGQSLKKLHDKSSDPSNPLHKVRIAQEIIDYVDDGRNPDIFTRDFVDLVLRGNAVMNGKQKAFKDFSKIYAKALKDNFDGMDAEIDMVMANAGMVEKDGKFVDSEQNGKAV